MEKLHISTLLLLNSFLPNSGKFLKKHLAANFKKVSKLVRVWGKLVPDIARARDAKLVR